MNFALFLRQHALYRPERSAFITNRVWTYGELDKRVDALAAALMRAGIVERDRVAVLMKNSIEFIEVFLACSRIGAVFVPLNFRLAPDEIRFSLDHGRVKAIVVQPDYSGMIKELEPELSWLNWSSVASWDEAAGEVAYSQLGDSSDGNRLAASNPIEDVPLSSDSPQRILYTSGTTARPKAAIVTHGQVIAASAARVVDFRLNCEDVTITAGPLYHVGAMDTFMTTMLYLGGATVIIDKFDPENSLRLIDEYGVTATWLAPTMIRMLLDANVSAGRDLSSLRVVVAGGEASPASLLDREDSELPNVHFYNAYGLTESQGLVTVLDPEQRRDKFGSVGRVAWLREMRIVDGDDREVPPGTPGEIVARGPVVFPGYLYDEQATSVALRGGWLHTGDVGYLDDDGYLFVVDRKKDMILSGGENIASSEVERVLDKHEAVDEVAVVGMPDDRWGEVPVAYIVSRGGEIDAEELSQFCRQRLAKFKVPVRFHLLETMPRNSTGKVSKAQLREMAKA